LAGDSTITNLPERRLSCPFWGPSAFFLVVETLLTGADFLAATLVVTFVEAFAGRDTFTSGLGKAS
jgi:hypothetical protein